MVSSILNSILSAFRSFFGRFEETISCFQDCLTFLDIKMLKSDPFLFTYCMIFTRNFFSADYLLSLSFCDVEFWSFFKWLTIIFSCSILNWQKRLEFRVFRDKFSFSLDTPWQTLSCEIYFHKCQLTIKVMYNRGWFNKTFSLANLYVSLTQKRKQFVDLSFLI